MKLHKNIKIFTCTIQPITKETEAYLLFFWGKKNEKKHTQ